MLDDLRQSKEWARYLSSRGWKVEKLQIADYRLQVYVRKIPLIGSVVKIQRPSVIPPVEAIDKIARKHRALFVKLEPLPTVNCELLTSHGFVLDKAPSLPTKTVVIDLTKPEEKLWKDLSQNARRNIKKAQSYQLSVTSYRYGDRGSEEALRDFHLLLRKTGREKDFWPPSFKELKAKAQAFGENALLFLTYPPGHLVTQLPSHPIAGLFVLVHDGIAYYEHTAVSELGRKLNAPYLLTWEAIKHSKSISDQQSAISHFDFDGIYDPRYHRYTKHWQGFTTFKKRWGGKEVEYPPPLIKYYSPLAKFPF